MIEPIDKDGNVVPDLNRKVQIFFSGTGRSIIASGSVSPNDMESFGSTTPKLFNCRAKAIVRSTNDIGNAATVEADGLESAAAEMESK